MKTTDINTNVIKLTEIEKQTFDTSVKEIEINFNNLLNKKVQLETTEQDSNYILSGMYDNIPSVEDIFTSEFNSSNKKTLNKFEYFISRFDNDILFTFYERLEYTLLEVLIRKFIQIMESNDSISDKKEFPFTSEVDLQQYLMDRMIKFQPTV